MGRSGFSRRRVALASLALVSASPLLPQPLAAREAVATYRVEATTLPAALAEVARHGDLEIVSLEPSMGLIASPARVLPGDPVAALRLLLRGTGFRAVKVGPRSYRVERTRVVRRSEPRPAPAPASATTDDITVVGGKFPTRLKDYPGSEIRLPAQNSPLTAGARLGDLGRQSPVVFATAFGDGRDKFFIRGIADSSFNGASQPTTAIYVDDAPMSLGSPNPNLRLYDIAALEVLEGPQGTLYGAGSIGGVIRVVPQPVNLGEIEGMATAEAQVLGSEAGWKLGGALNLPVLTGTAGLRLVGYSERSPGYIDDPRRGDGINQVDVAGGRAAFALDLAGGFRLDASALYQHTRAGDAQYADGPGGTASPLLRRAALAQPYSSDIALGRLALRKRWEGGIELASVFSYGHRASFDRFDATQDSYGAGATVYDLERTSRALTSETRLGRQSTTGVSWIVAANVQEIVDGQSRAFGSPDGAMALDEVTNKTRSVSAFLQGRVPLGQKFDATVGLRYTVARTDSEPARRSIVSFVRGDTARHLDPTLALLWRADERTSLFARYQTGYRNGGVTVARGVGRVSDFKPDTIAMGEVGIRRPRRGDQGLDLSAAVSYAKWNNVLAELVTPRGTPITENTGNARLLALEATASWAGRSGWRLGGSVLFTDNHLAGDQVGQTAKSNRRLPDTPGLSARLSGGYEWHGPRGSVLGVDLVGRYVGRSVLGPGTLLDLSQGDYAEVDLRASARRGKVEAWLCIDNLLDARANRFALGNPLLLYRREGFVPLMPRQLRIGLSRAF